jgi:hypothetical protein
VKQSPHEICHCIETAKYNISNPSTLFKPYLLLHHFLLPLQPLRSPPPTTQALHHPPDRTEPPIRQDGLGARESSVLAGHFLPLPPPSPSAPPSRHHPTTILHHLPAAPAATPCHSTFATSANRRAATGPPSKVGGDQPCPNNLQTRDITGISSELEKKVEWGETIVFEGFYFTRVRFNFPLNE